MAKQREAGTHEMKMARSEDIARRAFQLFLDRGREAGHELDDWLQAEREVKAASPPAESASSRIRR